MEKPPVVAVAVRRPIGLKIFGIALALLILMTCVTLVSSLQVRRLGQQLDFLAEHYIQLDQLMGEVRAGGLGEIILMERILQNRPRLGLAAARAEAAERHKEAGDCEGDAVRKASARIRQAHPEARDWQLVVYELVKLCTAGRIARAEKLIGEARGMAPVREDPQQIELFARIGEKVGGVPDARQRLHAVFENYIQQASKTEERVLSVIRLQLEQDRTAVAREIADVSRMIHAGTRSSAAHARKLEERVQWLSWLITLAAFALGLLFAAYITRSLVKPVHDLLTGTKAIESGNLDVEVKLQSADEIAQLGDAFNHMVRELRQKERIKEMFGKYVDPRVVHDLLERKEFAQGGERRVMTVFFSDLQGFTGFAERMTPGAVVKLLNEYFGMMAEAIRAEHGIIDKYIGDSVMAFWGPPFSSESEHAALACYAALEQQARVARFQAMLPELTGLRKDVPKIRARMGLATGEVTVGSIGSEDARSYTVVGDTANLASRLEGTNKQYGTTILINEETRTLAGEAIEVREIDLVRVVGRTEAERIYELLGRKGAVAPEVMDLKREFEAGLQLYRQRRWDEARQRFERCLALAPGDGPSKVFLQRLRGTLPAADWDGSWTLDTK
ncbi:MAG TPA: adenylate/guanylate cyclase domain-containing protein [Burkholderiales bacterium]|nr:adenylate/guanylate cyclase domain-containing protein [Burkholderiales bacterium]